LRKLLVVVLALVCFAGAASADFYLQKTIDLSAFFTEGSDLGSVPMSVAYDGVSAYVGGYNDASTAGKVGVLRIDGLAPSASATYTPLAGSVLDVNGLEGYNSLAIGPSGGAPALFAGKDGANAGGSKIVAVNPASGALVSAFGAGGVVTNPGSRTRMHGGIAYDPGFAGAGSGVSHLESGQGRRQLTDATTGAEIYGVSGGAYTPGFVLFISTIGSVYRGHTYDPATGDLYVRVKNNVQRSVRSGANSVSGNSVIVDLTDADTIVGQNIGFISGGAPTDGADLIIFNDRTSVAAGQPFLTQVKLAASTGDGTEVQLLDGFGGMLALPDGNGLYSFAYSPMDNGLVISDFANNQLYVFGPSMVPEPSALAALAAGVLSLAGAMRRRR